MSSISRVLAAFRCWARKLIGRSSAAGPPDRLTTAVVLALVATRLTIGWHFFKEGTSKVHEGFSSAAFLRSATGPLAAVYHGLLKDEDGLQRLNFDPHLHGRNRINVDRTLAVWAVHRDRVSRYYGFDDRQRALAGRIFTQYAQQLTSFFAENRGDINQYFKGVERRDAGAADPARRHVASLRGQARRIERELRLQCAPWLAELDVLWTAYDQQLNALATDQQKRRRGNRPLRLKKPGEAGYLVAVRSPDGGRVTVRSSGKLIDVDFVDWFIPGFDLVIGTLLLLGLFTRLTSVLAALFLVSVIATQWPWSPGTVPVYYQSVELTSLLVLAAAGAGRFAGLDFFLANWRRSLRELGRLVSRRKRPAQQPAAQEAQDEPDA